MDSELSCPAQPRLRPGVSVAVEGGLASLTRGEVRCSFSFAEDDASHVVRLLRDLEAGGRPVDRLAGRSPAIADRIPGLLADFDRLRLLVESVPPPLDSCRTGRQLYREVRRVADRVAGRTARSSFLGALVEHRATARQLIGYALEYYWIVKAAPGLIAPALASAHSAGERTQLQAFLKSELGHDGFLGHALEAVGIGAQERELHQPLPSTFALGASLGVYARQHPLSFKALLFLFERSQPAFVDAFDQRCAELGLPEQFYLPLRRHADLNEDFDHADISRNLLELVEAVTEEECTVVKRHAVLMVETLVQQEEDILSFYAADRPAIARNYG